MNELYEIFMGDEYGRRLTPLSAVSNVSIALEAGGIGSLSLSVDPNLYSQYVDLDNMIEIRRKVSGSTYTPICIGFLRYWKSNKDSLVLRGPDQYELLRRRIVAYAAGSSQAAKTDYADDMMKDIIRENIGASASASRQMSIINVTADTSSGPSITKAFSRKNILEVLKQINETSIGKGSPVYFLLKPVYTTNGITFDFVTKTGQPGRDLSKTNQALTISEEAGNLLSPELEFDFLATATYIYAGGEGEGSDRVVKEATSPSETARSAWNRIEAFVTATDQEGGDDQITERANEALAAMRPVVRFNGTIGETANFIYGIDWTLGDVVTASYQGMKFSSLVKSVAINITPASSQISAKIEAVVPISELPV